MWPNSWNDKWSRPGLAPAEKSLSGIGSLERLLRDICEVAHYEPNDGFYCLTSARQFPFRALHFPARILQPIDVTIR